MAILLSTLQLPRRSSATFLQYSQIYPYIGSLGMRSYISVLRIGIHVAIDRLLAAFMPIHYLNGYTGTAPLWVYIAECMAHTHYLR